MFDQRYKLGRMLGCGGMAEVFLAHDSHLNRDVAIKILFKRFAHDPEFVTRFRHEAQAAACINHPNIVAIHDWGEAEGSYYISMEYLKGLTLRQLLQEEEPDEDKALDITLQVLRALDFAHNQNIVHRDVNPNNLIIDRFNNVKITDFGIAWAGHHTTVTTAGSVLGTARYMSPEQTCGAHCSPASDLYSVGVVLYEMLAGRVPFDGDNLMAIMFQQQNDTPASLRSLNSGVSKELDRIVIKALQNDLKYRYSTAKSFLADVERYRSNVLRAPSVTPVEEQTADLLSEKKTARIVPIASTPVVPQVQTNQVTVASPMQTQQSPTVIAQIPLQQMTDARPGTINAVLTSRKSSVLNLMTFFIAGLLLISIGAIAGFIFYISNTEKSPAAGAITQPGTTTVLVHDGSGNSTSTRSDKQSDDVQAFQTSFDDLIAENDRHQQNIADTAVQINKVAPDIPGSLMSSISALQGDLRDLKSRAGRLEPPSGYSQSHTDFLKLIDLNITRSDALYRGSTAWRNRQPDFENIFMEGQSAKESYDNLYPKFQTEYSGARTS